MTSAAPSRPAPVRVDNVEAAVDLLLSRVEGALHVGAPLALGKPHRLLNALHARIQADPSRPMHLYTALSLDPPGGGKGLEQRFLAPFVKRHFGDDFPRLSYVQAVRHDALPDHMEVEEFYLQSGAMLGSTQIQRRYASLNYTHVARALADRGLNVLVQKVAIEPGVDPAQARLSLSCNTDLTFDAVDAIVARGLPRPMLIAEIDPHLPWLDGGDAAVEAGYFDVVISPAAPHPALFALPRQPVSDADYAIGFFASTLVRDGGTLQIGIGTLADALSHALALRHGDNAAYRRVLDALDPHVATHPAVVASGGLGTFEHGLYGCSEMLNEGFKRLVEVGVIRRKVVDDVALMRRLADGTGSDDDRAALERDGQYLHGAFYLGSTAFYDWLRHLPDDQRRAIGMRRVGQVNQLYGGNEALERLQRRDARFFNSCMMATALGAATSDALDDGRVVSGVGGQYNFVAMAHALPDARSVLMFRASRDAAGRASTNVVWNYGHTTIPRHLRDIYITEYGIADLRGRADEDCVVAMAAIADARFQAPLLDRARANGKLRRDHAPPTTWSRNTPQQLREALAPLRRDGSLPDYPLGSDFDEVEQRLVKALGWLKAHTTNRTGKLRTVARALLGGGTAGRDEAAFERMALAAPHGLTERLEARLLALGLRETAAP
ncbi:acetyl-CoA hydrolase/transferase C-terminal domain-containing protein [Montanilutibacter psychrotolerans]|uniref:Acetyl-CoA hydrolase n=1 Tax=Montanilutibacter psychrotolerans TaxID=1327343 RepID=A0A3M8SX22_9GAMM|nr:acetyl-CoA hydrolase/transferase C-terminal domain-containing protein [Lysobacter psychrotolerans]RNF85917.1 acetyl-CoA hydrolase [Lysobacter psychrotolerans]